MGDAEPQQWSIDKNIMMSLGIFLFLQTSAAVWWAASISRDVAQATQVAAQLRSEAYTRLEASLQTQNRDERLNNMTARIQEIDQRLREIEKSLNRAGVYNNNRTTQ